jgi:hypothetical protein
MPCERERGRKQKIISYNGEKAGVKSPAFFFDSSSREKNQVLPSAIHVFESDVPAVGGSRVFARW